MRATSSSASKSVWAACIGLWATTALLAGCGAGSPVRFSGDAAAPVVAPEQIAAFASPPADATRLGTLESHCTLTQRRSEIDDEPLSDVDCSPSRLRWALAERAAQIGAVAIVDEGCFSDDSSEARRLQITCEASAWRRDARPVVRGPGVSPDVARRIDFGYTLDAWRVRLTFEPAAGARPDHALRGDLVDEVARMPPGRITLGTVSARCDQCSLDTLRAGVRVAAGRLGASDVVGVRCFTNAESATCSGQAAAFAHSPDLDPRMP